MSRFKKYTCQKLIDLKIITWIQDENQFEVGNGNVINFSHFVKIYLSERKTKRHIEEGTEQTFS